MRRINIGAMILVALFALLILLTANAPEEIDWLPDYTSDSKIPYGGRASYDYYESMNEGDVETVLVPAYTQLNNRDFEQVNYVFFNEGFRADQYDVEELMRFVHAGNTVFISAYEFSDALMDTLDFSTGDMVFSQLLSDSGSTIGQAQAASNPVVNPVNPNLKGKKNYSFPAHAENFGFTRFDTLKSEVLGMNSRGYANFIRKRHGKGTFYLHTVPDAFINYHASEKNLAPYVYGLFSYLPKARTFWDDYYKAGYRLEGDTRSLIISDASLFTAYWLVLLTLLIGLLFGAKRRQRVVPVVKPLENTTLEFVEVVGLLYYQQHNTTDILHKKINYFLESIRSRFNVKTHSFDGAFVKKVAGLSGVPEQQVGALFAEIQQRLQAMAATDEDLKRMDELMWEFNKNSKR